MSNPSGTYSIDIGPMTNLGFLTRRQWTFYDDIVTRWEDDRESGDGYASISNVVYSKRFGGLILAPNTTLTAMPHTSVTVLAGDVRTSTAPAFGVTGCLGYNATANHVVRLQGGLLAEGPCCTVSLVRTLDPPNGQGRPTQLWKFTFGGLVLTWGRTSDPVLTRSGVEVARYTVPESQREEYSNAVRMTWDIANIGGRLFLTCSALRDTWEIAMPTLPATRWQWETNGGKHWVNVSQVTFAATGSIVTPLINERVARDAADAVKTVYPTAELPATAVVTLGAATDNQRAYTLTLGGTGYTTPLVRAYQVYYPPIVTPPTTTWTAIDAWFVSGREQLTEEMAARSTDLRFVTDAAWEAAFPRLSGHRVVRYTVGYNDGQGHTDSELRMVGIMRRVSRNGHDLTMTLFDQWTMLRDTRLSSMPCLYGMERGAAISLIAQCASIPSSQIVIDADVVGTVGNATSDPGKEGPRWRVATGTTAADAIRRIASTYGLRVEFQGDGKLHVYQDDTTTIALHVSAAEGTPAYLGIGKGVFDGVTFDSDLAGTINYLYFVGKDPRGKPLTAQVYDYGSLNTTTAENYLGYAAVEYQEHLDIDTQEELQEALARQLTSIDRGYPRCEITSDAGYALTLLWPRSYIGVTDTDVFTGERTCKITQLVCEYAEDRPPRPTLTLEVLPDGS